QPEGPMTQVKLPGARSNSRSRSTSVSEPSAARKDLRTILTSSGPGACAGSPAVGMGLKRLNHQEFDEQHDADEGESVAENGGDIEQLEIEVDLEADAIRASEQLDHQDDLPDQRQPGAAGCGNEGEELWQHHVAQQPQPREAEH